MLVDAVGFADLDVRDDRWVPDEFEEPEFALHELRVVVLNMPEDDVPDLDAVLATFAEDFVANEGWVILDGPNSRVAIWRGWIPGGVPSAYVALAPVIDEHELEILLSDSRLDIAASGNAGEVVVSGLYRRPRMIEKAQFAEIVGGALNPEELVRGLLGLAWSEHDGVAVVERREEPDEPQDVFVPPRVVHEIAPGRIDWSYLVDASLCVCDEYDPEGNVEDLRAVFILGRVRIELLAPGVFEPSAGSQQIEYRWRAIQSFDDDEREVRLEHLSLARVLELLPSRCRGWVYDATRDGLDGAAAWLDEEPDDVDDVRREHDALARELEELFPRGRS